MAFAPFGTGTWEDWMRIVAGSEFVRAVLTRVDWGLRTVAHDCIRRRAHILLMPVFPDEWCASAAAKSMFGGVSLAGSTCTTMYCLSCVAPWLLLLAVLFAVVMFIFGYGPDPRRKWREGGGSLSAAAEGSAPAPPLESPPIAAPAAGSVTEFPKAEEAVPLPTKKGGRGRIRVRTSRTTHEKTAVVE